MYEIFTLGGGTYLVDLLNAVAAITSGGAYVTLAQLAGAAGLAWVLFRTAFGGSWKDNGKWILMFVAVWGAMIVPKATVRVVDRLDPALAPAVVADVPIGLALFASVTSEIGDGLTQLTEQAFALPNDLAYRRHGMIFGARLAAEATRLEVTDAVFARNLRDYARQCVFYALLLGHVSADDLRESTDLWALVTSTSRSPSAGASPARMVEFATRNSSGGVDRAVVTCADAAGRLNALWTAEVQRAGGVFGRRLFPGAATDALARAELMAALPAAHDFLIGASRSAAEVIRQQMLLNALHAAGEQWASEAGNAPALAAYTEARAEAQTVAAYRAIGRQAETWVPMLKIVFECLYVGAFPVAVLLMLTPAGAAIFKSYLSGLVWLQSWGPLYAILHRIAMGEAAERMGAVALMPGGDVGVSLVAQAGIRAVAADVAVMSGYLSMSVPFLAAALAFGVSRMTSLASSVLHVGQEAASAAAREGATGNLALASTQLDTHRYATLEGRQVRTSAHVDDHRHTAYAPSGAAFTVTGDGTVIADAASATSRVPAAGVRLSESLAATHDQRASEARGLSWRFSAEAGAARNAAVTDAARLAERYAHDVSAGEVYARGVTESESAQVQELESHYERMAETAGLTKDQMAVLAAEARIGGGWDFVVKVGAEGSARWRGQTMKSEAFNRMREYADRHQVLDLWSRVSDASRRYATQTGDSQHAGLEESLAANLTDMRRFEERASLARQESESWSEQAARVRSDAQAIDRDLGQPFFVWLSEREDAGGRPLGTAGAIRLASPQTPEEAETLRQYAAAFVEERFPEPAGPATGAVGDWSDYEAERQALDELQARETEALYGGWTQRVNEQAERVGAPAAGTVDVQAGEAREATRARMAGGEAERAARGGAARSDVRAGQAGVEEKVDQPLSRHVIESVPGVGERLAGKLFGTAANAAPDGASQRADSQRADQ
ncbi:MAG: conjugal transfer protein TraG N-terminal domain-containing protein [Gammaproteobacteria bacterium]|nr:conjugal transfer protein TraG N-terminal domain-containing protein [Gammaproteobacteria bacterium]